MWLEAVVFEQHRCVTSPFSQTASTLMDSKHSSSYWKCKHAIVLKQFVACHSEHWQELSFWSWSFFKWCISHHPIGSSCLWHPTERLNSLSVSSQPSVKAVLSSKLFKNTFGHDNILIWRQFLQNLRFIPNKLLLIFPYHTPGRMAYWNDSYILTNDDYW